LVNYIVSLCLSSTTDLRRRHDVPSERERRPHPPIGNVSNRLHIPGVLNQDVAAHRPACGDTVVHRVTASGTHLGEFPPGIGPGRALDAMPATGRSFEADQIHIHRVRGGKITGHAATRNDLLMLSQLGLLPGIEPVSEAAWRTQLTPDVPPPA
jgi:hypothetical protein